MFLDIFATKHIPPSCTPDNGFLEWLSTTTHSCIPTNLALISTLLGVCSIASWLFAQLPQIIKNFRARSTSGLSILFLAEWLFGDLSNLFGSLFTDQATWQVVLATYYCSVDCVLVGQWMWYEHLQHGRVVRRLRWWRQDGGPEMPRKRRKSSKMKPKPGLFLDPSSAAGPSGSMPIATPKRKFLRDLSGSPSPRFPVPSSLPGIPQIPLSFPGTPLGTSPAAGASTPSRVLRPSGSRNPLVLGTSPKTTMMIILLVAMLSRANPLPSEQPFITIVSKRHSSFASLAGRILSWLSTFLYLGSRLPQLLHNYTRRSTSGLSPVLFAAAFFGNLFYSTSLLANPSLWRSFPPYDPSNPESGGKGWAPHGSSRETWALNAAPFFLGAAGVLVMDAAIGVQFIMYGNGISSDATGKTGERTVLVVEAEPGVRGPSRWMQVNGWMRGWMPAASAKHGKSRAYDSDADTETSTTVSETDTETETETDLETDAEDEGDENESLLGGRGRGKRSKNVTRYGSVRP